MRVYLTGFPHSEIAGSKLVCSSPTLIAAYHVLHRLPMPRHPPEALSNLIKKSKKVLFFGLLPEFSCQRSVSDSMARTGRFQKHPKNFVGVSTLARSTSRICCFQEPSVPGSGFRCAQAWPEGSVRSFLAVVVRSSLTRGTRPASWWR